MLAKSRSEVIASDSNSPGIKQPLDFDSKVSLSRGKPQTPNPKGTPKQTPALFTYAAAYSQDQPAEKSLPTKKELSLVDRMLQDLEVAAR